MEVASIVVAWYAVGWVGSALILYSFYKEFGSVSVGDLVVGAVLAVFGPICLASSLFVSFIMYLERSDVFSKKVFERKMK